MPRRVTGAAQVKESCTERLPADVGGFRAVGFLWGFVCQPPLDVNPARDRPFAVVGASGGGTEAEGREWPIRSRLR
jgi:hypothetical protein